ncbi:MAG: hypothetical protein L3K26_20410, partial [Candidatus Hydrogenedentes bacterium]|nr:hypothetical protein [Candidatus Hydrogenedentota bacterium]
EMLEKLGTIHPSLPPVLGLLALLAGAITVHLLVKFVVVRAVRAVAKRSNIAWDDVLVTHNVFGRLVQVVPALIIVSGVPFVAGLAESYADFIHNLAIAYIVLTLTMAATATLSAANATPVRASG